MDGRVIAPRLSGTRLVGLRGRVVVGFGLLAIGMALLMAIALWLVASRAFDRQREASLRAEATDHAQLVEAELRRRAEPDPELLGRFRFPPRTGAVLTVGARSYGNPATDTLVLPEGIQGDPPPGTTSLRRVIIDGHPYAVASRRLTDDHGVYTELAPLADLPRILSRWWWLVFAGVVLAGLAGTAVGWAAGRPVGRKATDLDERIQAEARFAGEVGHELRNPITTMVNSLEVLEHRRHLLPAEVIEPLDLLSGDVRRVRRLAVELLDISRSDDRISAGELSEVVVADLVRRVADATAGRPVTKVSPGAEEATALVDRRRMERVLANLVENADRHGGGCVEVLVGIADDVVRVCVRDRGPGIPAERRVEVFDRFVHDVSGAVDAPGVGLGLAIVQRHVRSHGGEVWAQDAPGGGADFVVQLPRCGSRAPAVQKWSGVGPALGRRLR